MAKILFAQVICSPCTVKTFFLVFYTRIYFMKIKAFISNALVRKTTEKQEIIN